MMWFEEDDDGLVTPPEVTNTPPPAGTPPPLAEIPPVATTLSDVDDLIQRFRADLCIGSLSEKDVTVLMVGAMTDAALRSQLLTVLLQMVIDTPAQDASSRAALRRIVELACSNAGTEVQVLPPSPESGVPAEGETSVGVLVLGFAGANMGMLQLLCRSYQRLRPRWRVVATTRCGVTGPEAMPIKHMQLDEIMSGLAPCSRILVHAMSNNGQVLWASLLQRLPNLRSRVAAFVFDCVGPMYTMYDSDAEFSDQVFPQAVCSHLKLVLALSLTVLLRPCARSGRSSCIRSSRRRCLRRP